MTISGEKTIEVATNNAVTFTRRPLEPFAIEDRYAPVGIANQPGRLKHSRHHGHGLTPHAEHHGEKFMAQLKILLMHPIVGHQEPSTTPFLNLVPRIERRRLHHLGDHDLGVSSHQVRQSATPDALGPKSLHGHHLGAGIGYLNHCLAGRKGALAEKRFDPHHAFITNGRRLHHGSIRQNRRDRRHAAVREIDVIHGLPASVKHLPGAGWNGLQNWTEAAKVFLRQRRQDPVLGSISGRSGSGRQTSKRRAFGHDLAPVDCFDKTGASPGARYRGASSSEKQDYLRVLDPRPGRYNSYRPFISTITFDDETASGSVRRTIRTRHPSHLRDPR